MFPGRLRQRHRHRPRHRRRLRPRHRQRHANEQETAMIALSVGLHFAKGYIGNPYWPAMERVITIRRQSGVDRARSEDKRAKTLKAWLESHEMTLADYRALEA